ncbi:MAG: SDR family oxidoreductase [Planctomycetota bacterium]
MTLTPEEQKLGTPTAALNLSPTDVPEPDGSLPKIAVTGATGYVGGRLAPLLIERGHAIRCLVRAPKKLDERPWRDLAGVEVAQSDLSDVDQLTEKLRGCQVGYYLVHSMVATGDEYAKEDQRLARNFAKAAAAAGVERIIYLGGLGEMGSGLSEHLRSRREVENILASTGVPVTTFRAAMIIGSGSASFEILRYLVERLPVMLTPRWVQTECQPVAIADVLYWLAECLRVPETRGEVLEIGGPDVLSYRELMRVMAQELELRPRLVIGIPFLTPRLSSAWISLVTPVTYRIARPLAEGLSNRVVVGEKTAQRLMPHQALTARQAIEKAIARTAAEWIQTRWSAAGPIPGDPDWAGGKVFVDERSIEINASPDAVFDAVCRVGGGHGWYAGDILWQIRGWMDTLVGGPGLRRGRRLKEKIEYGEALDFWRVVGVQRPNSLLLHAEMKLPGVAQLGFKIDPVDQADAALGPSESAEPHTGGPRTKLTMTARFRPKGLFGLAYWYAVVPLHHFVFGGMLGGIKRAAEKEGQALAAA